MSSFPLVDALRDDLTTAFTELVEDADALADAATVERLLCMGVLPLDDPDLPDEAIAAAVAALEQQGTRAAPLLAAAELLGTPRLRAIASAALERLRAQDGELRAPAGLGQLRLRDSLGLRSDEADIYLLSLARPGDSREQTAMVVVEHEETGGALVEGFLGEPEAPSEAARLREQIIGKAPEPLVREEPSAGEVRAALIAAAERTRELDLQVDFELVSWLPLLSLAVTGDSQALGHLTADEPLELPDMLYVDPDDADGFEAMADEILSDFDEEVLAAVDEDSPLARSGSFVARAMLEFKWGYKDGLLAHWTAAEVEEFLLDHAPRKLSQPGDEAEDNPDCVIALLEFFDEVGGLEGDTLGTLIRVTESLRSEAARAARSPDGAAGPSQMRGAGDQGRRRRKRKAERAARRRNRR